MPYRRTSKQISSNRRSCRFQGEGEQKMPHWRIWKQIWTLKGGMLVCRGSHNKAPTTENSSKIDFLTALEARSPRARSWHVWILWSPLSYSLASYSLQYSWASLVAQLVKNLQCGDLGSIPGLGRSPGEGKDYPLQYSGLENSMDCIAGGFFTIWATKEALMITFPCL